MIGADILGRHREVAPLGRRGRRGAAAACFGRTGYPLPPGAAQTGIVMPEISATHVRALLAGLSPADRAHLARLPSGQDPAVASELRALLPETVLWYIARSGIYL